MMTTDYQRFTKKSTPSEERSKLGIGDIFSNAATCLICKETIRMTTEDVNVVICLWMWGVGTSKGGSRKRTLTEMRSSTMMM